VLLSISGFDFLGKRPNRLGVMGFFGSVFSLVATLGGSLTNLGDLRVITGDPASRNGIRDKSWDRKVSTEVAAEGFAVG
jgi:hypothetical protein